MAMDAAKETFRKWLGEKLIELETDDDVFGMYIEGILDGDEETPEEKAEALKAILTEIIESNAKIIVVCNEIMGMWMKCFNIAQTPSAGPSREDVDTKLVKLLESQTLATTKQKEYTDEEKKIREAILSQYSQMTDDEDDDAEPSPCVGDHKDSTLEKNTNASSVLQAEKEKREQARLESQRKKDKDKEDREKQKQLKEEKKEKRKTQKGERRR